MRTSNIELLRIFAMFMIVIHHVLVQGIFPIIGEDNLTCRVVDSFVIYGVNLFLLISGYFTIRFSWKKLISLLWICSFYKIFHLFFRFFYLDENINLVEWIGKPLGVVFSTGGWFMDNYLLLFFISPLVNKVLFNSNRNEYVKGLIILFLINVVYGWLFSNNVNCNGYNLNHFIFIYYIGYGIKKLNSSKLLQIGLRHALLAFFVCSFVQVICCVAINGFDYQNKLLDYNNPIVLCASVCLFQVFALQRRLYANWINVVAASMLPVYLVHHQSGFVGWFMGNISLLYICNETIFAVVFIALIVIALFVFTILIDQLRKLLAPYIVSPIANVCEALTRKVSLQ